MREVTQTIYLDRTHTIFLPSMTVGNIYEDPFGLFFGQVQLGEIIGIRTVRKVCYGVWEIPW